jgi:hypothetical protein
MRTMRRWVLPISLLATLLAALVIGAILLPGPAATPDHRPALEADTIIARLGADDIDQARRAIDELATSVGDPPVLPFDPVDALDAASHHGPDLQHRLFLVLCSCHGAQARSALDLIARWGIEYGDVAIARDAWLIRAVLRSHGDATSRPATAAWARDAQRLALPMLEGPDALVDPIESMRIAWANHAQSNEAKAAALIPPSPEPIEEEAHWPVPRWMIALRVEMLPADERTRIARSLLESYDNHVRRAGLLACGLLSIEPEAITRIESSDDDQKNRQYARLVRLMGMRDATAERDRLIDGVIAQAEAGRIASDDALFALLATGSPRALDWMLEPLTPRRSVEDDALGWGVPARDPSAPSLWPMLLRFTDIGDAIPAHASDDARTRRLHADAVRVWWLLHRRRYTPAEPER